MSDQIAEPGQLWVANSDDTSVFFIERHWRDGSYGWYYVLKFNAKNACRQSVLHKDSLQAFFTRIA